MDKNIEIKATTARLIANTKKKKRPDNILTIARDIRYLQNELGSLKSVSKSIGISTDMLSQFLSVEKLCPSVKKLVKKRGIDLVNIVHYISNFKPHDQKLISTEILNGNLTPTDLRVLVPFKKNHPNLPIGELISHIKETKNIKVYIAYFEVPDYIDDLEKIRKTFEKIVGKKEIIELTSVGTIGILEFTAKGKERIGREAKDNKLSTRKYINVVLDTLR